MKKYISLKPLLLTALCFSITITAQTNKTNETVEVVTKTVETVKGIFKKKKENKKETASEKEVDATIMNKDLIFKSLFGRIDVDANNEILWKFKSNVSLDDIKQHAFSEDNFFHTSLDNIFYFSDNDKESVLAVLFTYKYVLSEDKKKFIRADCHMCNPVMGIATFTKETDGKWKLFNNTILAIAAGSFGEKPKYSFQNLGKNMDVLVINDGYGNQGKYDEYVNYVAVNNVDYLKSIFNYSSIDSYDGGWDEKKAYLISQTSVESTSSNSAYKIITLKKKKNDKLLSNETYFFSETERVYVKKATPNTKSNTPKAITPQKAVVTAKTKEIKPEAEKKVVEKNTPNKNTAPVKKTTVQKME